ncbi:nuclear transport factor 2 family protein [Agitococcus lubricus]|nr:nuclear transport factor 2 family protein [Agitococcus lubricus]
MKSLQNQQLLDKFYRAFQQRDGEAMAQSYDANATFSDPAFGLLQGQQVGDMWRMLTERAQDFSLQYKLLSIDDNKGEAEWTASYTFSQTGRTVVNHIHSEFRFQNGKIVAQQDQFDLWRWSRQALGLKGYLLGWTPLVQHKIQQQATKNLANYQQNKSR